MIGSQSRTTVYDISDLSYREVWIRSSTTPSQPTGSSLSAPGGGWSQNQPTTPAGQPLYSCGGYFDRNGKLYGSWLQVIKKEGVDGPQGVRAGKFLGMFTGATEEEADALAEDSDAAISFGGLVETDFYLFTTSTVEDQGDSKIRVYSASLWGDDETPSSDMVTAAWKLIVDRASFLEDGVVTPLSTTKIIKKLFTKFISAQDVEVSGTINAKDGSFSGELRAIHGGIAGFQVRSVWSGSTTIPAGTGYSTVKDILNGLAAGCATLNQSTFLYAITSDGGEVGRLFFLDTGPYGQRGVFIYDLGGNLSPNYLVNTLPFDLEIKKIYSDIEIGSNILPGSHGSWISIGSESYPFKAVHSNSFYGNLEGTINWKTPGSGAGQIPVNNGVLNTNLNAQLLDGNPSTAFCLLSQWAATTTTSGGTKSSAFTIPAMVVGAVYTFTKSSSSQFTITLPSGSLFIIARSDGLAFQAKSGGGTFDVSTTSGTITVYVWRIR